MASNSQHHRDKLSQYLNSHRSKSKNPVLNEQTSKNKSTVVQKKSPTSNRLKLPHIPQPHFKKKASVDDLPDEILSFIFWKLPVGDLINASQTCKRWHVVQADNLLWQRLYIKFAGPLSDEAIAETPVCELKPGCWKNLCLNSLIKSEHPNNLISQKVQIKERCNLPEEMEESRQLHWPDSKARKQLGVDGEVAFITVTFHNHNLVSCCLCGHVDRIWIPPKIKPIEDDIDPNYGLHGYKCVLLLRNMRQQLLEFKSTDMYCSKDKLNDGFASYTLVKKDDKLTHVVALKELSFPWKTELFKGIIKGVCILNLTLLDERGQPFWTVSSFVQVCQSVHTDQFEFNPGCYCSIDYSDDTGKLHAEIGKLDDSQEYLSSLKICLSFDAINKAFKTGYK